MDALLILLLVIVGFALFILIVNRSVKYIAFCALAALVVLGAMMLGGVGL